MFANIVFAGNGAVLKEETEEDTASTDSAVLEMAKKRPYAKLAKKKKS